MIRVALVDDQTLVRSGIRGLLHLTDDIRVVAEAADGEAARAMLAAISVDVLLLDVRMPGCDGLALLRNPPAALPPTISPKSCCGSTSCSSTLSDRSRSRRS